MIFFRVIQRGRYCVSVLLFLHVTHLGTYQTPVPLMGNWEISLTASFTTNSKPHTEKNVTLFKFCCDPLCPLRPLHHC